jgi:hypothetical protein
MCRSCWRSVHRQVSYSKHPSSTNCHFFRRVLAYPSIQPLFDTISTSPILKHYTFTDKIHSLVSTIIPSTPPSLITANNTLVLQAHLPPPPASSLPYEDPCSVLASIDAPFRTFAHLRGLPTPFNVPAAPDYYTQRCSPTVSQLVGRLGTVRTALSPSSSDPTLKHVYVIDGPLGLTHNEWAFRKRWFEELSFELTSKYGWESVRWARAGAKAEAVAVDMEIAARAEAFVGNGVSFSLRLLLESLRV